MRLDAEGIELRLGVEITKVEVRGDRKVCIFRDIARGTTGEVAGSRSCSSPPAGWHRLTA